ncbi:MAG: universal stress protein [Desulfobulbus sp.]|jgi:nucleotide-binding universal stress UspA family protein
MEHSVSPHLSEAKTLLLATDGSEYSEGAAREAIFWSRFCGARLIVLHVITSHAESIAAANFALRRGQQELSEHLDRIHALAREHGVPTEVVVVGNSAPEQAIIEQAQLHRADMILMGRHGRSRRFSLPLGKMTAKVIARGFPRVLVAPSKTPSPGSHLLLAFDDSPNSREAAAEAFAMSRSCQPPEKITVLSVSAREEEREQARQRVESVCARARELDLPVPCEPLVRVGDPAKCIVQAGRDQAVDMILIGGWTRGGVISLLKSHVTENVIGQTECAVLVISS